MSQVDARFRFVSCLFIKYSSFSYITSDPQNRWHFSGGTENGRSWPVLAGPSNFFFSKRRAPHPQEISITWMRTPFRVLRLKIKKKYFLEKFWDFIFSRTGQDRPRPARTGQDRPRPAKIGQDRPFSVTPHFSRFSLFQNNLEFKSQKLKV